MKIIKISYPKFNANHDRKVFVVNFGGEEYVLYLPISSKMYLGEVPEPEISEEVIKKAIISYLLGKFFYYPFDCVRHVILDEDRDRGKNSVVKLILSSRRDDRKEVIKNREEAIKKIYSTRLAEEREEVLEILETLKVS